MLRHFFQGHVCTPGEKKRKKERKKERKRERRGKTKRKNGNTDTSVFLHGWHRSDLFEIRAYSVTFSSLNWIKKEFAQIVTANLEVYLSNLLRTKRTTFLNRCY